MPIDFSGPPIGQPQPTDKPTGTAGGALPTIEPRVARAQAVPPGTQVSIPAVDAVASVTADPFVRGALVGLLVGAGLVGVIWWVGRK